MGKFWSLFFIFWSVVAVVASAISPSMGWWFPHEAASPLGQQIDDLFYLILYITSIVFVGTQVAMGYVLWKGATSHNEKALFTHGSHSLEVIWTIVPAFILLFLAWYQIPVWEQFRFQSHFPKDAVNAPIAEVTARQFEWRIRYPAPGRVFKDKKDIEAWLKQPEAGDLYSVNDLHVPSNKPVMIHLRSGDVQHSFFIPELRVKQDAVPGMVIPVWFEAMKSKSYDMLCAELCGWGHYKMKARVVAEREEEFAEYLRELEREQFDDGVADEAKPTEESQEEVSE
ncbi:MAG: cytochrome c oxidase subunit II [Planctomycetaceae bacterium]